MNSFSFKMRAVFMAAITAALLVAMLPSRAQAAPDYLPLAVGKKWTLHSNNWGVDVSFEVLGYSEGVYQVRFNNPWLFWEYGFVPLKERVYMQSLSIGSDVMNMRGYSSFFDFELPVGASSEVVLGTRTILSDSKVVTTSSATYSNCLEMSLVSSDGFTQRFTFAPGVGLVEYQLADGRFVLDEPRSVLNGQPDVFQLPPGPVVSRGDRALGIDLTLTQNASFEAALAHAQAAGLQEVGLLMEWNELEYAPQQYDLFYFDVANLYYPSIDTPMNLTLAPIHNSRNTLPSDLLGLPLDHPLVIQRFKQLLDAVFSRIPNLTLNSLAIGSEVDGFMLDDPVKWQQFTNLFVNVAAHARALRPGLKVTTEVQFLEGFFGNSRARIQALMQYADVVGLTYYPLDLQGNVLDPDIIPMHFDMIRRAFPGKPIHFYQIGYPTSPVLQSSEVLQARFIEEVFRAWDAYSDQIKLVDFTWLSDKSLQEAQAVGGDFGQSSQQFVEYIRTLGMRTYPGSGTDKLGYSVLTLEAAARGW